MPATGVVALDQFTKWLIRTTPALQNVDIIKGWLAFHYTQNPGMALGLDFLSTPVISTISILATIGIFIYLMRSLNHTQTGYLILMGLILGGACGNISDRLFMGIIEGYGGLLQGHVVDFIHFNLEINDWPVFPYIFNVADISISVSIVSLLLFSKKFFDVKKEQTTENDDGAINPKAEELPIHLDTKQEN